MAPVRGIKNKKVITKPEIQLQDEPEMEPDNPQSSRDAEFEALKREVRVLTEALKNQQLCNPLEEPELHDGFEKPFATQNHRVPELGNHRAKATQFGPWRVEDHSNHRSTIPKPPNPHQLRDPHLSLHQEEAHEEGLGFEDYHGPTQGALCARGVGQMKPNPPFDPF